MIREEQHKEAQLPEYDSEVQQRGGALENPDSAGKKPGWEML